MLPLFLKFWQIWVILLVLVAIRLFFGWLDIEVDNWHIRRKFKKGEAWRSDRELLQWLGSMRPSEFEKYIADLFHRLGYTAEAVGKSHDGGIDVIAEKGGVKNYIQCKKFITREVTVSTVRDFYGAIADRVANGQGYFITTNKFTLEARKFAEDKPIELIDGFELIRYIRLADKNSKSSRDAEVVGQKIEKCPKCGGALIDRTGKFGKFLGCTNYPKCDYTRDI